MGPLLSCLKYPSWGLSLRNCLSHLTFIIPLRLSVFELCIGIIKEIPKVSFIKRTRREIFPYGVYYFRILSTQNIFATVKSLGIFLTADFIIFNLHSKIIK